MRQILAAMLLLLALGQTPARAQWSVDLKSLPAEIKSLKWEAVELSALTPLQRCQALLLMNQVLDEMGGQLVAEADLMSAYIDQQGMGPTFASQAPVTDPAALTFEDAEKIAAALLQGPMAQSPYASQLADSSPDVLKAYEQLYTSTCKSKWGVMKNNQLRVRAMSHFLQEQGKVEAYQAWVPGEVQRQAQQHEQQVAARRAAQAAQAAQSNEKIDEAIQRNDEQMREQAAASEQAARSMQQAMAAAQAQRESEPNVVGYVVPPSWGYPGYYYGGWGAVAPADWYRDGAYRGMAEARTDARMNAWHGGGFHR